MNALFSYSGSKAKMSPKYVALFPPHEVYVSVFGGTGAEFAVKQRSTREVYNDLDRNCYTVFACLRDTSLFRPLIGLLRNSHDSRRLYGECYDRLADDNLSAVERAWCFLVIGNIGFHGQHPLRSSYCTGLFRIAHLWLGVPKNVAAWSERMQGTECENLDYSELMDAYDNRRTFFFCDPPYDGCSPRMYVVGHQFDHERFLRRVKTLRGKCMICGYPSAKYDKALRGWKKREWQVTQSFVGRSKRAETVWMNYNI